MKRHTLVFYFFSRQKSKTEMLIKAYVKNFQCAYGGSKMHPGSIHAETVSAKMLHSACTCIGGYKYLNISLFRGMCAK